VTILLVISLVKVNKNLCHITKRGGGEGGEMTLNVTLGEERGIKSVAYFFNGPLYQRKTTQYFQQLTNK
jgi:hypothetical protein